MSKSRRTASWNRESGQGTLEYILVLVITVILFLTVVWQFNDAFRSYAENFFDGYVACLLETGELPGRGGNCTADYKAFKIADGKPLINGPLGDGSTGGPGGAGTGGGGAGAGSGGKTGDAGKNADAGNKGAGGSGGDGGGGGGGGESGPPAGATTVGSIGNRGKGRSKSTAVGAAKDEQGQDGGSSESLVGPMAGMGARGTESSSGRAKRTALDRGYGYWGQQEQAEAAESKAPIKSVSPKNENGNNLRSKKTSVDMSRKTASVASGSDDGFSLGSLIRYILIAGIVLAIVVFFGGQLLQISKSSEK
ncbi:MAG: hypothetical protein V4760_01995 [Bdellovibrionota bacterium]